MPGPNASRAQRCRRWFISPSPMPILRDAASRRVLARSCASQPTRCAVDFEELTFKPPAYYRGETLLFRRDSRAAEPCLERCAGANGIALAPVAFARPPVE